MNDAIRKLWPELEWIKDPDLREKTGQVWEYALERSVLTVEDLHRIPFTLLSEKAVTFMAHKRSVVHVCRECARVMEEIYGVALPIDVELGIAGELKVLSPFEIWLKAPGAGTVQASFTGKTPDEALTS